MRNFKRARTSVTRMFQRMTQIYLLFIIVLSACNNTAAPTVPASSPTAPVAESGSYTLRIDTAGSGSVQSLPEGLKCSSATGTSCEQKFNPGDSITLKAIPEPGNTLGGWTGVCEGSSETCTLKLDSSKTVSITFQAGDGDLIGLPIGR